MYAKYDGKFVALKNEVSLKDDNLMMKKKKRNEKKLIGMSLHELYWQKKKKKKKKWFYGTNKMKSCLNILIFANSQYFILLEHFSWSKPIKWNPTINMWVNL